MSTWKKLLISGAAVAGVATLVGAGTFATFNAQTRNPSNTFANGTIVLSNTKQGGSACLSTAGGTTDTNVNNSCDQLFNLSVKRPGDSGAANLTVQNVGSVAATIFKVFSTACTGGDAAGESYHGTGNPCSDVQLYVQQWANSNFTSPSACLYGGTSAANTCDFSDATKTLSTFQASYNSSSNGLQIGSALGANASAYFTIGVKEPSTAGNSDQGRQASTDFTWYAEQ